MGLSPGCGVAATTHFFSRSMASLKMAVPIVSVVGMCMAPAGANKEPSSSG